jgi:hypothetical protein
MIGRQHKPRTHIDIVPWLTVAIVLAGIGFLMLKGKPDSYCPRDQDNLLTSLPSCQGMVWTQEE